MVPGLVRQSLIGFRQGQRDAKAAPPRRNPGKEFADPLIPWFTVEKKRATRFKLLDRCRRWKQSFAAWAKKNRRQEGQRHQAHDSPNHLRDRKSTRLNS